MQKRELVEGFTHAMAGAGDRHNRGVASLGLPGPVASLEGRIELFRQEVKVEINTAFNKLMLYFTALAAALAILTFLR